MEKATRQQTKEHNTSLVLKIIYAQDKVSRADVSRETQLTRTTVSDIVGELIEQGLVEETGVGFSAGGKPPILLQLKEDARLMICLDLSGAEFRGAVINLRGKICHQETLPINGDVGVGLLERIYQLMDMLLKNVDAPLIGLGVATPGLVDHEKGIVRRSVHLDWVDVPLKGLLSERYHLPVYLINDSHAAALAETTFGEIRQAPNLIVVRIGKGIGSGIILSGHLHYGDGFGAGEIGHLTVVEGGRQCSCGNYGCLETVASPGALVQTLRELSEYDWISFKSNQAFDPEIIDWNFVRQAFQAGDETVTQLVKEAGRYLGVSIANLVSILNIERIVISGAYQDFGSMFLQAISEEVKRRSLLTMAAETHIQNSILGPENVLLGASALVLQRELGLP